MLVLVFLIACSNAYTQQTGSAQHPQTIDSTKENFVDHVQRLAREEANESIVKFKEDKLLTRQAELVDMLQKATADAKAFVKVGLDTIGVNNELNKIDNWYIIASDGVFVNKGTAQTNRNLETSGKILKELLSRTAARKAALDAYHKRLITFRNRIDSISSDTLLYKFPNDSLALINYVRRLIPAADEINPADSILKQALLHVEALQLRINTLVNELDVAIEQVEIFKQQLFQTTLQPEFHNLLSPVGYTRPFEEIVKFSLQKAMLALYFYADNHVIRILLLIVLIISSWFFLKALKQQLAAHGEPEDNNTNKLVLRYPFLSAVMIIFNIFQFAFPDPPFVFNMILWIIESVCLTIIFRHFITRYWMQFWYIIFILFILACADNLILQASRIERWCMLLLAFAGSITSGYFLLKKHREELKEKWIIYFIGFVIVTGVVSIICNFYGRYNFSKNLLTSGFFNVIIAISFLWTIRLINEGLTIASRIYKRPDKKLFYINFHKIGDKAPAMFYVLLVIGWFVLFARNFYAFNLITQPLKNFIFSDRTIGDFTFSIQSLLTFFIILFLSAFVSRVVSFFASDRISDHTHHFAKTGRVGLGSWLLIIRIAIISTGVFFAFAAAGIPVDRITIILGALGVGIGLGLQSLVNNLVSGLIISFERPINIGDIVELDNKSGVVKSIGFRSSVIATWDGADVIIPNGDILSSKMINWKLGNTSRRGDVKVSVAYNSDLDHVQTILNSILANHKRILKQPAPSVILVEFNQSAIDLQLFFWVKYYKELKEIKSDLIAQINVAFKENNITIPFPQQDIHIHSDKEKNDERNSGDSKSFL